MSSTSATTFQSIPSDRFLIRQKLGSGSFGDVFRAWDRKLEAVVALKTLHRADPAAIYYFKNEFRSLADVTHPNLVQLYELQSEDRRWFFTMELVEGLDFLEYAGAAADELSDTTQVHPLPAPVVRHDFGRLRGALRQLAEGLCALHRAGKLHCDIKPTNLRVTADGRLVLLDFGLVHDLAGAMFQTMVGEVRGTPAYMSPEQAVGREVSEASDWYAVGGVLYEALTGELPFAGSVLEVLKDKRLADGPSPRKAVPYLPDDLAELCEGLLALRPADRPTGEQVLERLGGGWTGQTELGTVPGGAHFVGRELELAALEEAFELSRSGQAVAVFVHGASGLGKTELIGRFVERVRLSEPPPVILAGRCHERESVPFKGLDALIDTLSRYLKHLSYDQAAALLPPDVAALTRLFPALSRVEAVAAAPAERSEAGDEREQRRRARLALRQLFARLTRRSPVLLVVDDLQWGDHDSAAMLADLLAPPAPPALMLVGAFRDDGSGNGPRLRQLLARHSADGPAVRELEVGKLWFSESCELGLKLLGHRRTPALGLVRTIARESGGSPLFIGELVRYARSELGYIGGGALADVSGLAPSGLSLDGLIRSRLGRLPAGARRLLELVAIAGRPVAQDVAVAAAAVTGSSLTAIKLLLAASLLRLRSTPGRELETCHDRIRETVLAGLDGGRQARLHGRLARAYEQSAAADPETLTRHYHAAGDSARAAELAGVAARQACGALAFDRGVRLFRLALELETGAGGRRRLQIELGDALVNVGRRAEAARAYLAAAAASAGSEALELQRRACEQQFFGGDFEGCLRSLETVLASIDLTLPRGTLRPLASFVLRRLGSRLRQGSPLRPAPGPAASEIGREERWRLDVLWTAVLVSMRHPIRTMDFQARYQSLARRLGEPCHLLHALATEAALSAMAGVRSRRRTARRLAAAARLAERIATPAAAAESTCAAGFAALLESRAGEACELFERSERLMFRLPPSGGTWRDSGTDFFWGSSRVAVLKVYALILRGRWREMLARLPAMLKDLAEKGNLYDETDLRSRAAWVARLAADEPEKAAKEIHRAQALLERQTGSELWPRRAPETRASGWALWPGATGPEARPRSPGQESPSGGAGTSHRLRHYHLLGLVEIALYRGQDMEAWRILEARWRSLRRGLHFRVQLLRVEALGLRCRAALAAANRADSKERARLLRSALAGACRLEAEKLGWARGLARLVRAGAAAAGGRGEEAGNLLAAAETELRAADFELYAAACRRRRGQLLGAAGAGLVAEADGWMERQGIASPERMARVLAPGRWRPRGVPPARLSDHLR